MEDLLQRLRKERRRALLVFGAFVLVAAVLQVLGRVL